VLVLVVVVEPSGFLRPEDSTTRTTTTTTTVQDQEAGRAWSGTRKLALTFSAEPVKYVISPPRVSMLPLE